MANKLLTNLEYATQNLDFRLACLKHGEIGHTRDAKGELLSADKLKRQASKWRRKKGIIFRKYIMCLDDR